MGISIIPNMSLEFHVGRIVYKTNYVLANILKAFRYQAVHILKEAKIRMCFSSLVTTPKEAHQKRYKN